jgi:hypothetical protein
MMTKPLDEKVLLIRECDVTLFFQQFLAENTVPAPKVYGRRRGTERHNFSSQPFNRVAGL